MDAIKKHLPMVGLAAVAVGLGIALVAVSVAHSRMKCPECPSCPTGPGMMRTMDRPPPFLLVAKDECLLTGATFVGKSGSARGAVIGTVVLKFSNVADVPLALTLELANAWGDRELVSYRGRSQTQLNMPLSKAFPLPPSSRFSITVVNLEGKSDRFCFDTLEVEAYHN
jgi:hypothetical protein